MSSQFAKGKLKLIKEGLASKDWAAVQKQATSVTEPSASAFPPQHSIPN